MIKGDFQPYKILNLIVDFGKEYLRYKMNVLHL